MQGAKVLVGLLWLLYCSELIKLSPREWAAVVLELKNLPSPKSPSLTTPDAVMKTLAGLISVERVEILCLKFDFKPQII